MNSFTQCATRALILAPTGRDARLMASLLCEIGVTADICNDLTSLADAMRWGAGLALIADEALREVDLRPIANFMTEQGEWSDLPIILLTHKGGVPGRDPELMRMADALGNVNFLERPFHAATLASMVRAAGRNRHRQYEARARHAEIFEREQQLQCALNAGRLGAWSLHASDLRLKTSPASRAHFGRGLHEPFTFADMTGSIHLAERQQRLDQLHQVLRSGADYCSEFRNYWPDGTEHWIEMRARALKNADGSVERLVGVSADISARKIAELERERLMAELAAERTALSNLTRTLEHRVEEGLTQLRAEIATREKTQLQLLQSQKMESVGQLTGGIAHDFNNLLMAIMGSLQILRKRTPDEPSIRRLIDGASQAATRGASLTQRMLAFARQQELRTVSADLGTLIEGMQELLQRSMGPQIRLTITVDEGLPPAEVDPHQVELAVLNLAINARDAMPDGGAIDIKVEVDEVKNQYGGELKAGRYVRIQMADTGSGMDAATLAKAIEPFFSTKPAGKGTGLGLSMAHGLARQLGGALSLRSQPGRGTVVTLWLPVALLPAETPGSTEAAVKVERVAKVLIVDDDPLVAMSTVDMLTDLGHSVTEANSGERALKLIDSGLEFDLLITDQAMPGMTGIELAERARAKRPRMPVLLVTGYADLPACELARLPRLSKPYSQAQLQMAIEGLQARPDAIQFRQRARGKLDPIGLELWRARDLSTRH
jgi:signal transduction histidine kinase/FixJ family two-component response regulator